MGMNVVSLKVLVQRRIYILGLFDYGISRARTYMARQLPRLACPHQNESMKST